MNTDMLLDLIEEAPVDTGKKSRGGMVLNKQDWTPIVEAIRSKGTGVRIPFATIKKVVGSDSTSLNNFVYQLSRAFKANQIPLHAGQRHMTEEDEETGDKTEIDYVALNLV